MNRTKKILIFIVLNLMYCGAELKSQDVYDYLETKRIDVLDSSFLSSYKILYDEYLNSSVSFHTDIKCDSSNKKFVLMYVSGKQYKLPYEGRKNYSRDRVLDFKISGDTIKALTLGFLFVWIKDHFTDEYILSKSYSGSIYYFNGKIINDKVYLYYEDVENNVSFPCRCAYSEFNNEKFNDVRCLPHSDTIPMPYLYGMSFFDIGSMNKLIASRYSYDIKLYNIRDEIIDSLQRMEFMSYPKWEKRRRSKNLGNILEEMSQYFIFVRADFVNDSTILTCYLIPSDSVGYILSPEKVRYDIWKYKDCKWNLWAKNLRNLTLPTEQTESAKYCFKLGIDYVVRNGNIMKVIEYSLPFSEIHSSCNCKQVGDDMNKYLLDHDLRYSVMLFEVK